MIFDLVMEFNRLINDLCELHSIPDAEFEIGNLRITLVESVTPQRCARECSIYIQSHQDKVCTA